MEPCDPWKIDKYPGSGSTSRGADVGAEGLDRARRLAGVAGWPASVDDDHDRFAFYQSISDEPHWRLALLACLLTEPNTDMATSVALRLLEAVEPWERDVIILTVSESNRERVVKRARDLELLELLQRGPTADEKPSVADERLALLLDGSDWLQRRAADAFVAPTVLSALAEGGRTKKVRARAAERLRLVSKG